MIDKFGSQPWADAYPWADLPPFGYLPVLYWDFSEMGVMPSWLIHNGFTVTDGEAHANPSLGSELIANTDAESGVSPWIAVGAGADITTDADAHSGAAAFKVTRGQYNSAARPNPDAGITGGAIIQLTGWCKKSTGADRVGLGLYDGVTSQRETWISDGSDYEQVSVFKITSASATYARPYMLVGNDSGDIGLFDDLSMKQITTADCFALVKRKNVYSVKSVATSYGGGFAAVVAYLDDRTNPQNGLMALYDRPQGAVVFRQLLNGDLLTLVGVVKAYVPGAAIEIRRVGADSYAVFYNEEQVGDAQTVSGLTGEWAGFFSTDSLSKFADLEIR